MDKILLLVIYFDHAFFSITLYTISPDGCKQSLAPQPQPLPPCLKRMRTIVMKSILIDHFIKDVKREIVFKVPFIYYVCACRGRDNFCLLLAKGGFPKRSDNVLTYVCLFDQAIPCTSLIPQNFYSMGKYTVIHSD